MIKKPKIIPFEDTKARLEAEIINSNIKQQIKQQEHIVFCKGHPTKFKHIYNEDTEILTISCVNCGKVIYECEFKCEAEQKVYLRKKR
jgi:hypothetical protein